LNFKGPFFILRQPAKECGPPADSSTPPNRFAIRPARLGKLQSKSRFGKMNDQHLLELPHAVGAVLYLFALASLALSLILNRR